MKGFMHIVEIVLIAILVFFVFGQFASIPSISGDWSEIKLSLMAKDLLQTFDKKGIDWFNGTSLAMAFNQTLPENIIYAVTLQNVIKPKIKMGCLCDSSEYATVQSILSPRSFAINGVNTTFEVVQVTSQNELFSLDFDMALVYGYEDLTSSYGALRNFLNYDKGVVEIADIPRIDNVQLTIFGLNSSRTKVSDTTKIVFSSSSKENGKETNKIYDYFSHVPVFQDAFATPDNWFGGTAAATGKPPPSLNLTASGCSSENAAFTRFYTSFRTGEIDFDVYPNSSSAVFMKFAKSTDYEYYASISANQSISHDAFYRKALLPPSTLQPIGSNTSHLAEAGKWNHVKIVARMGELTLYDNGQKVATAQVPGLLDSNISVFSRCREAYLDNIIVTQEEGKMLDNFLANENITQLNDNQNKILLVQTGTGLPACIINYNVEGIGRGRTVWLSNSSGYASDDYKTLVKALMVWAAGNEYKAIKADIKKPVSYHIYKAMSSDMMQNAKIILELGYLY
jgi:hypothetical protein